MNYGLYLSASGVLASSRRQDVIANNLANSETAGFKRDLALFQERRTEARERGWNPRTRSNPLLEGLGGGLSMTPTAVDISQGDLETTANPFDLAIQGRGYFAVRDAGEMRLTRDGRLYIDQSGRLAKSAGGQEVLSDKGQPITLQPGVPATISEDGTITQNGAPVARIGLWEVPNPILLSKHGSTLLGYPQIEKNVRPADGLIHSFTIERGNVEPATELAELLDAQRELEANANLIRYQDQMLSRLVNDVAKIG